MAAADLSSRWLFAALNESFDLAVRSDAAWRVAKGASAKDLELKQVFKVSS